MKLLSTSQAKISWISPLLILIAVGGSLILSLVAINHVFAQPQTPAVSAAPGKISGRVTNPAGEPLAGITVCIAVSYSFYDHCPDHGQNNGQTLLTNANGEYQMVGLGAGEYNVYFHDPADNYFGQYFDQVQLGGTPTPVLVIGNPVSGIDATLTPAAKITGTVGLMAANSYIVSGQVDLFHFTMEGWQLYSSDYLGQAAQAYRFLELAPGDYRLCARVQIGWQNSEFPDFIDQECYHEVATVEQAVSLVLTTGVTMSNINFLFGEEEGFSRQLTGRVTDAAGKPLANITVIGYPYEPNATWEWGESTKTDGTGHYALIHLRYSHYLLQFFDQTGKHGFTYYPNVPTLAQAMPITLTQNTITNVNATLDASAQISGHERYSSGDIPAHGQIRLFQQLDGQWPRILPIPFAVDTATGAYHIRGLAAGVYRLQALNNNAGDPLYADGYYGGATLAAATDVPLTTGETKVDVNIEVAHGRYEGVITGSVTAAGQGQSGIRVTLYRLINLESGPQTIPVKLLHLLTEADGHYTIAGLETGSYKVHFSDPNRRYAPSYAGDRLTQSASPTYIITGSSVISQVNTVLQPAGSFSGAVYTSNGMALPTITVVLLGFEPISGWGTYELPIAHTDAFGHYQIGGLLPGRYGVYFVDPSARYQNFHHGATDQLDLAQVFEVNAGAMTTGIDGVLEPLRHAYLPFIISPRVSAARD